MGRSILSYINRLTLAVLIAATAITGACSDDSTEGPENKNPTIELNIPVLATTRDWTVTFTAVVADPDEDPLTVNWQVLRDGQPSGTLNPDDQGTTSMRWTAPAGNDYAGSDAVIATVSDGNGGSATATETILVGTLRATGSLAASDTWTVDKSPYVIRPGGDAYGIPNGITLTIEPGVQVLADKASLSIQVNGRLMAGNASGEPVVFRSNNREPEAGDWEGITAVPNGPTAPQVHLTNTQVMHAVDGVSANTSATVELVGCRLMFNSEHAVRFWATGTLTVTDCVITNNKRSGIRVVDSSLGIPTVTIHADSISVNGDVSGGAQSDEDAGVVIEVIDPNGTGNIDITCNEISRNGVPGILLTNVNFPNIRNNGIFGNEFGQTGSRFDIRLADNFGTGGMSTELPAVDNFWGSPYPNPADSVQIKSHIRDIERAPGAGIKVKVIVWPWLSTWPDPSCP